MAKISYTIDMSRKDVKAIDAIRREAEEKMGKEALETYLSKHCDAISAAIEDQAKLGFRSCEYELKEDIVGNFCFNPRTQIAAIINLLVEGGYEAYPFEDEGGVDYMIQIEW